VYGRRELKNVRIVKGKIDGFNRYRETLIKTL
jgi:hypothetical protein